MSTRRGVFFMGADLPRASNITTWPGSAGDVAAHSHPPVRVLSAGHQPQAQTGRGQQNLLTNGNFGIFRNI